MARNPLIYNAFHIHGYKWLTPGEPMVNDGQSVVHPSLIPVTVNVYPLAQSQAIGRIAGIMVICGRS